MPKQEQGNNFSFPVQINYPEVRTAVALVNPAVYGTPTSVEEILVLNLFDQDGSIFRTTTVSLNPGQQLARYLDNLFPNLTTFTGSTSISSPFGAGVLSLRKDDNAFGGMSTDGGPVLGPFMLASTPIAEVEPNDTSTTSMLIYGSTVIAGTIGYAGEKDMFKFNGKAGDIVSVACSTSGLLSDLDSIVEIYDSQMKFIGIPPWLFDPPLFFNSQNSRLSNLHFFYWGIPSTLKAPRG